MFLPFEDLDSENRSPGANFIEILEFVPLDSPLIDEGPVFTLQILNEAAGRPDIQQEMVTGDLPVRLRLKNEVRLGRTSYEERVSLVEFKNTTGLRTFDNLESNNHDCVRFYRIQGKEPVGPDPSARGRRTSDVGVRTTSARYLPRTTVPVTAQRNRWSACSKGKAITR